MDLASFEESLSNSAPPGGQPPLLVALWHERKGDWNRAHEIAQDINGRDAAWVHRRKECREAKCASRPWGGMFAVPPERGTSDAGRI
jgi:hypothetical protein